MKKLFALLMFLPGLLFGQGTTPTVQVKNITALKAIAIPTVNNRLTAIVAGTNNTSPGVYYYDAASTTAVDDVEVLKPNNSNGRWLIIKPAPAGNIRISYEGDSIVNQALPTWPDYIPTFASRFANAAYVTNYGVSGGRIATMVGQYQNEAYHNRPQKSTDEAWFFLQGGGNDLVDGTTPAQVYADLLALWNAARLDGYKVVAMTVTPRYDFNVAVTNAARVVELNRLILSDQSLYDYVIRADVTLSDASASSNAYYYDGTHPTVWGAQIIAKTASVVINAHPWRLLPTTLANTNEVAMDLLLNPNGRNVAIGMTNISESKFSVAKSFVAPSGGITSTNTVALFANNNAANANAWLSLLARSSGSSRINFGTESSESGGYLNYQHAAGDAFGHTFNAGGKLGFQIDSSRVRNYMGWRINRTATGIGVTAQSTNHYIACTAGTITIALPDASTTGDGAVYIVKDAVGGAAAANITIDPAGGDTIDGAATYVIAVNYRAVTLVSDGANNYEIISVSP